jgi:amino acid adenylation domain-containing protein
MRNLNQAKAVSPSSGLSVAKQALLKKWLRGESGECHTTPGGLTRRRDAPSPAPLSFQQQQLWFFYQLAPESAFYTLPMAMRLKGVLEPQALLEALDAAVARHQALRTRFVGDIPVPSTRVASPTPMTVVDLRGLQARQREAEARRLLEAEARRPFDLSKDLLIRTMLVQLEQEEWIFVVLIHHIAGDDWSWRVLCDELAVVYEAAISGRRASLPELPLEYADFATWQRSWLRGEVLEDQLAYWRRQLAGAPTLLKLPTDHSRPAAQTFRGACEWLTLPRALGQELNALSQRAGVTLFTTLLAAFQTLIHRYTGQEDILVGSPAAGRTRANLERLVGVFINTLVLRVELSGNPSFGKLLGDVQATVLEALAKQELPFETLVQELEPERKPGYSPLIQVMFGLQDELADALHLPGVAVSPFRLDTGTAKFDLTLSVMKSGAGLSCCAEYNTELFERATIDRLLAHYENLLQGIVENPARRLWDLPLLTGRERQQLLVEWNRTESDFPRTQCVHDLFAAQVKAIPAAVAVIFEERQLTYRELNRKANQLAHHLRRLGVVPGKLVAICLDRSLEMVIGMLATLKAGGAYLPVAPSCPAERLRFMLEESKATVLLTNQQPDGAGAQSSVRSELRLPGMRTICLTADWPQIAAEPEDEPRVEVTPASLAYVIYTSGSTGQPKGVQIPHSAVVNFLHAMRREPGLSKEDTFLAVTNICFDIAGLEIFLPLTMGARVVVAGGETVVDPARLAALIRDSKATMMQATPSLWRLLVESGWSGEKRLKILCGGESLSRELANELLERGAALWNLYGPTETTIWSALTRIEPGEGLISIGRPIANTQIYVLDPHMEPVPLGVTGELFIGGEGVALGYLRQPELTVQKFISNPFSSNSPSARLYKTGDLGRYRPDGKIECLGRTDYQIKLRGHRIDLGEIEATLRRHPGVSEALVVLREAEPDRKLLAAYLICAAGSTAETRDLRRFLKVSLPDYMIPEAFVVLDQFPLTPNGKLDRKALPKPVPPSTAETQPSDLPATPLEETLARIWREVLQLDEVGMHDNFFEQGGNSLLATMVASRLRSFLQLDLSVRQMLETPTIAGIARILAQQQPDPAFQPIPRLPDAGAFSSGQDEIDHLRPESLASAGVA